MRKNRTNKILVFLIIVGIMTVQKTEITKSAAIEEILLQEPENAETEIAEPVNSEIESNEQETTENKKPEDETTEDEEQKPENQETENQVTEEVKPAELDLGDYQTEMAIGDKQLLTVTVLPLDTTEQTVTYSSDNTKVAEINGMGRITQWERQKLLLSVVL